MAACHRPKLPDRTPVLPAMAAPPPTIVTGRLVLRLPGSSDDGAIFAYASDPEVTRYLPWRRHTDVREAAAFRKEVLEGWKSGGEFTWCITVQPADDPVGAISLGVRGHAAVVGFVISRKDWGKGYATEAATAVTDWASSVAGIVRVWATCDTGNAASARVLEKIGMTREGLLRCWGPCPNLGPNVLRDHFVYAWVRGTASPELS